MKRQTGLSLVELMIAILISTLLLLGVLQLFSNSSDADRSNTALARIQESGRVALELIGADARRVGFQGCVSPKTSTTIGNLVLPDDAVATGTGSITFRYAVTDATAGSQLPGARACPDGTQDFYLRTATYSNCNGSLCLNNGPILNGAQLTAISFAIPSGANVTWKTAPTAAELLAAQAVRITLQVSDARQNISRDFIGTYQFRNRRP